MTGRRRPLSGPRVLGIAITLLGGLVRCTDTPVTSVPSQALSGDILTDAAKVSLSDVGTFILAHAVLDPSIPEIEGGSARALAAGFLKQYGEFFHGPLEKDRGASINLSRLRACNRTFYAEGAYKAVPVATPAVIRKAMGPQWIVQFCEGATPEVAVYISAYATDAELSPKGDGLSRLGEANFVLQGMPVGIEIPASPEFAALRVSQLTQRRVAGAPTLVMRPSPKGPALAVWRIMLESPARVSRGNRNWPAGEIFAGHFSTWDTQLLAADDSIMPTPSTEFVFDPPPGSAETAQSGIVFLNDPRVSQLTLIDSEGK